MAAKTVPTNVQFLQEARALDELAQLLVVILVQINVDQAQTSDLVPLLIQRVEQIVGGLRGHFTVYQLECSQGIFGFADDRDQGLKGFLSKCVIHIYELIHASQLTHAFEEDGEVFIVEVVSIQVEFDCNVVEDGECNF